MSRSLLTGHARRLRKNMTKEERKLWYEFLRPLPLTVHRQKIVGNYIADFYIAAEKTVIELDGSQHFLPDGKENDAHRDEFFQNAGISVLRFSNEEIRSNFDGVCQKIAMHLGLKWGK